MKRHSYGVLPLSPSGTESDQMIYSEMKILDHDLESFGPLSHQHTDLKTLHWFYQQAFQERTLGLDS